MDGNDAHAGKPAKRSAPKKTSAKRVVSAADEEVSGHGRKKRARRGDIGAAVDVAIESAIVAIQAGGKSTVADLIRLLQLRRELEGERPRKITARWIEECEPSIEK